MQTQEYVLGIDAGGTSTRCWAVTLSGQVLGVGKGGPGNLYSVGVEGLVERIGVVARAAVGSHSVAAEALCLGAAGLGRPTEIAMVRQALEKQALAKQLVIENDGYIGLAAGTLGDPGVAVISGTGSIAVGLSADGQRARAGGWGYLLGDEGSGYFLAHQALIAVLRAHDGRAAATNLGDVLLPALGITTPEGLVALFYSKGVEKEQIAALAPHVLAAAESDSVAAGIVATAADELALLAQAVHQRLKLSSTNPVVVSGGMFQSTSFLQSFNCAVEQRLPHVNVIRTPWAAQLGAVIIALRQAGVRTSWQAAQQLAQQIESL